MALSPSERAKINGDAPAAEEKPPATAKPPTDQPTLAPSTLEALEELDAEIDSLFRARVIDRFEAAVYRLHVETLRDARAKAAERSKALEAIAKMRGMYRARDGGKAKSNTEKTMRELLDELSALSGVSTIPIVPFEKLDVPQEPIVKRTESSHVGVPKL